MTTRTANNTTLETLQMAELAVQLETTQANLAAFIADQAARLAAAGSDRYEAVSALDTIYRAAREGLAALGLAEPGESFATPEGPTFTTAQSEALRRMVKAHDAGTSLTEAYLLSFVTVEDLDWLAANGWARQVGSGDGHDYWTATVEGARLVYSVD